MFGQTLLPAPQTSPVGLARRWQAKNARCGGSSGVLRIHARWRLTDVILTHEILRITLIYREIIESCGPENECVIWVCEK